MTDLSIPVPSAAARPILHVSVADLEMINFEHLFSETLAEVTREAALNAIHPRQGGQTDWSAPHLGRKLSLCWDWIELDDGHLRTFRQVAPRTNFQIVEHAGRIITSHAQSTMLWELIERKCWRNEVRAALHESAMRPPGTHPLSRRLH